MTREGPRPAHLIRRTAAALAALYDDGRPGLTLPQFVVLDCIKRHGPHTVMELIKLTGIDRATFCLMLAKMREEGWVENGPPAPSDKPGPRPKVLLLSPRGRRKLLAAEPVLWDAEKALLERLTPQQRAQFLDALAVTAFSGPK